jgi:hypothetical protein
VRLARKILRTSYVNFDDGFWDEASNSFWHANHMQYKDAARAAAIDFDRIVFGVALAQNYNPGLAAIATQAHIEASRAFPRPRRAWHRARHVHLWRFPPNDQHPERLDDHQQR